MSDLLERYIDGELSEAEAERFMAQLERDPVLAERLHSYERMLAEATAPTGDRTTADFTDRVMKRVRHQKVRALARGEQLSTAGNRPALMQWSALAACLVIAFGLGAVAPSLMTVDPGGGMIDPGGTVVLTPVDLVQGQVRPASASTAEPGYRLVRLEYMPTSADVRQVAVAGTFNGWDPGSTPMQKADGAYQVYLMLPAGMHEYQFVEDGARWVTDPLALHTRDDGFGSRNAVVDIAI